MRAVTLADTLPAVRWRPVWRGVAPKRLSSEFPVDHASRTGWGRTVRPPRRSAHRPDTITASGFDGTVVLEPAQPVGGGWARRSATVSWRCS